MRDVLVLFEGVGLLPISVFDYLAVKVFDFPLESRDSREWRFLLLLLFVQLLQELCIQSSQTLVLSQELLVLCDNVIVVDSKRLLSVCDALIQLCKQLLDLLLEFSH